MYVKLRKTEAGSIVNAMTSQFAQGQIFWLG